MHQKKNIIIRENLVKKLKLKKVFHFKVKMDFRDFFNKLNDSSRNFDEQGKEQMEPKLIWDMIFSLNIQNSNLISTVISRLIQYSLINTVFRDKNPEIVREKINTIDKNDTSDEDFVKNCFLLLNFICFLTDENAKLFLEKLENKINGYSQTDTIIPKFIINILKDVNVSAGDNILSFVYEKFTSTNCSFGFYIVYSLFVQTIIDNNIDEELVTFSKSLTFFDGDELTSIAGIFIYMKLSSTFNDESNYNSSPLFNKTLDLFQSRNVFIHTHSLKLLHNLIDNNIFVNRNYVQHLLKLYKDISVEYLSDYFKLLQYFLDNNENIPLEIPQCIYDFVSSNLESSSPERKYLFVDLLTSICMVNSSFVNLISNRFMKIVYDDIELGDLNFIRASGVFLSVVKSTLSEDQKIKIKNTLISSLNSHLPIKDKLEISESISSLYGFNEMNIEFIIKSIPESMKGSVLYYLIPAVRNCSESIPEDYANKIFQEFSKLLKNLLVSQKFNNILDMLCSLNVSKEILDPFIDDLIYGKFDIFCSLPVYLIDDESTFVFHFINSYVEKYHNFKHIDTIIGWISEASVGLLPLILEPVNTSVSFDLVKNKDELCDKLITTLEDLTIGDEDPVCAILTIVMECGVKSDKYFKAVKGLLAESFDSESTSFAKVLLYLVYSSDVVEDEDLVDFLLEYFPLLENTSLNAGIFTELLKHKRHISINQRLAELFILKQSEYHKYGLKSLPVNDYIKIFSAELNNDPKLKSELQEHFSNSKAKLSRFNSVFK